MTFFPEFLLGPASWRLTCRVVFSQYLRGTHIRAGFWSFPPSLCILCADRGHCSLDDAFPLLPAVLFPVRSLSRNCSASVIWQLPHHPPCWVGLWLSLCLGFSAVWLRVNPLGVTELLRMWVDFPFLSNWKKISQHFLEYFAASFFFLVLLTLQPHVC